MEIYKYFLFLGGGSIKTMQRGNESEILYLGATGYSAGLMHGWLQLVLELIIDLIGQTGAGDRTSSLRSNKQQELVSIIISRKRYRKQVSLYWHYAIVPTFRFKAKIP